MARQGDHRRHGSNAGGVHALTAFTGSGCTVPEPAAIPRLDSSTDDLAGVAHVEITQRRYLDHWLMGCNSIPRLASSSTYSLPGIASSGVRTPRSFTSPRTWKSPVMASE